MDAKEKMAIPPQPMPEQDAKVRARNMKEVALGYDAEAAKKEAEAANAEKNPAPAEKKGGEKA